MTHPSSNQKTAEMLQGLQIDGSDRSDNSAEASVFPKMMVIACVFALGAGTGWYLSRQNHLDRLGPDSGRVEAGRLQTDSNKKVEKQIPVTAVATPLAIESDAEKVLDASGYVTARRQATVSSKITGKVMDVLIEEGDVVTQGQLLARLDDQLLAAQYRLSQSRLIAAKSGLLELDVQLKDANLNLARAKALFQKALTSRHELDNAELAVASILARINLVEKNIAVAQRELELQSQQLSDTEIRAPFPGVVINKAAQPGEMISPVSAGGGFTRTGICSLVDMDSLEIEVDVNESNINRVFPGQSVTATLNSYRDWVIPAEVITIIPTADRSKATVRVRIRFLENDQRILPDMGVKVAFFNKKNSVENSGE